ncbi:adenylate/guanylate cyclase domain-containing protein [Tistrella bauzanensis]|uniref:Adenylate/guanylate cyclase domain-containing protein n=1 Tax=Tistrella arctica TaxID=3133430 RepID=A0ABU9YH48_9PROT
MMEAERLDDATMLRTATPIRRSTVAPAMLGPDPIAEWLAQEGPRLPVAELVDGVARRLAAAGVPIDRASLHLRLLDPQFRGVSVEWRPDRPVEAVHRVHGVELTDAYLRSPFQLVVEHGAGVRRRLTGPGAQTSDFPILVDLKAEGFTDYVMLPIAFHDGTPNALSVATLTPGGFTEGDLRRISALLPILTLAVEIVSQRGQVRTLLKTYLGDDPGERVLAGTIKRGDVERMNAAIWFSDLRGFTAMSERLPPEVLIATLNEHFEVMAAAITAHGGQVMKLIGDGVLAVFPTHLHDGACPFAGCAALDAARDAERGMAALNARRAERGDEALSYGLGLHAGEVLYGNIGAPDRLDFTVIGQAVNQASRLEVLARDLGQTIAISSTIADAVAMIGRPLTPLGRFQLRGLAAEEEVYTLPQLA